MNRAIRAVAFAAATLAAPSASALTVEPTLWSGNGHYYLFIDNGYYFHETVALRHDQAAAAAAAATYLGMTGYLVTITSAAEQAFVRAFADAMAAYGSTNILIGASDSATEGNWIWGGGTEAGQSLLDGYTNWAPGEPEGWADYAAMGSVFHWQGAGSWFATDGYAMPYVIEFSPLASEGTAPAVPLPASGLMLGAAFIVAGLARRWARRSPAQ